MKSISHALITAGKYLVLNYLPRPFLSPLRRLHYARKLRRFPLEHEPDMGIVRCLVGPGDYVVDIGANVGLYTMVLSKLVGERGLVYSIEPVPETYGILVSNITKLCLGNAVHVNGAVSDSCGRVGMSIPCHLNRAENLYRAHIIEGEAGETPGPEVKALTLDAMFRGNFDKFTFVKCDVEGHELKCVKGGRHFLDKSDAGWLVEVTDDPDLRHTSAWSLFQEFLSRGYRAWWYDGIRLRARKKGDAHTNYFFLKERHVDAVRKNGVPLFAGCQ